MDAKELLNRYAEGQRDFTGINLSEGQLIGLELPGIILRSSLLNVVNFSNTNLSGADLSKSQLNVSRLTGANLSKADLRECKLNVANLIRSVLINANLTGASLIRAELLRANLSGAQLASADLSETDLREARLRQANLMGANLSRADLRGSIGAGAQLSQANLNHINGDRTDFMGANFTGADLRHALLSQANLSGAILKGANLRWANLNGANLSNADLTDAKLSGTKLVGASLEGANLTNTLLVHSDLSHANLMHASWVDSDASGAILSGVKLHGALHYNLVLTDTDCQWVDLSANGDRSRVQQFASSRELKAFFSRSPAQVQIITGTQLTPSQLCVIGSAGCQLAMASPLFTIPPSIDIAFRQTTLTYPATYDLALIAVAYGALTYFSNGPEVQQRISQLMGLLQKQLTMIPAGDAVVPKANRLLRELYQFKQQLASLPYQDQTHLKPNKAFPLKVLQLELVSSSHQRLPIYQYSPISPSNPSPPDVAYVEPEVEFQLPALLKFIQRCFSH